MIMKEDPVESKKVLWSPIIPIMMKQYGTWYLIRVILL